MPRFKYLFFGQFIIQNTLCYSTASIATGINIFHKDILFQTI
jgi:hypothetical protein